MPPQFSDPEPISVPVPPPAPPMSTPPPPVENTPMAYPPIPEAIRPDPNQISYPMPPIPTEEPVFQGTPSPAPDKPMQPARIKKHLPVVPLIIAGILAAGISGGGVYYWQTKLATKAKDSLQNDLIVQSETHKKELDAVKKSLADQKKELDAAKAQVTAATATKPDKDLVTAAVKTDCEAEVGAKATKISITKTITNFSQVSTTCTLGTQKNDYIAILKKVESAWVVINKSEALPDEDTAKSFGLPKGWYTTE